jgi:formylglycine-generating enzyme required for sulfatase activity/tRNA A-37 threonylcarbamoyl transferase component Bud32
VRDVDAAVRALAAELGWGDDVVAKVARALRDHDRYDDLGGIGRGGMGEVRRVRDRRLGRVVAMKRLRGDLPEPELLRARFEAEAELVAQLQHPGIPPLHDAGVGPDGLPWFTMKEVRGSTFAEHIRAVHAAVDDGRWAPGAGGWTLHRLVDAFAKVCDAVGYAHSRGVLHRDLKPDNIMVGAHGEVVVLDWGIAKVLGGPREERLTVPALDAAAQTRFGTMTGTMAYMPPEQAMGELERLGPASDVYALGVVLHEILTDTVPFAEVDPFMLVTRLMLGVRPPIRELLTARHASPPLLPEELVALCEAALSFEPADRPADGSAMAAGARAWLEGAARRARALALVAEAQVADEEAERQAAAAAVDRAAARAALSRLPPWAAEDEKAAGWALDDAAAAAEATVTRLRWEAERALQAALTLEATLPEAHAALAAACRRDHHHAERAGDASAVQRAALRLADHLAALPEPHPEVAVGRRHLRGWAAVDLVTDPEGAEVVAQAYTAGRRRVLGPPQPLGRTPLVGCSLPMGSYLLTVTAPGYPPLRVPVAVGRGERWEGVAPGDRSTTIVRLPREVEQGAVVVPAGWFRAGGDPEATGSLPARRLWAEGFVMQRFPVTQGAWLAWVNTLVARGDDAGVAVALPRARGGDGAPGAPQLRWVGGRFELPPGWAPDDPVFLVDWPAANAYAAYWAAETGRPWRLPGELEWEKAARGVDGRRFPWGDTFDASWACVGDSHPGEKRWASVHSFPVDASPYGVRGLAGNVRDWCADAWLPDGPPCVGDRVGRPVEGPMGAWRVRRGGSWGDMPGRARCADRDWYDPGYRYDYLGVRLVRDLS